MLLHFFAYHFVRGFSPGWQSNFISLQKKKRKFRYVISRGFNDWENNVVENFNKLKKKIFISLEIGFLIDRDVVNVVNLNISRFLKIKIDNFNEPIQNKKNGFCVWQIHLNMVHSILIHYRNNRWFSYILEHILNWPRFIYVHVWNWSKKIIDVIIV